MLGEAILSRRSQPRGRRRAHLATAAATRRHRPLLSKPPPSPPLSEVEDEEGTEGEEEREEKPQENGRGHRQNKTSAKTKEAKHTDLVWLTLSG